MSEFVLFLIWIQELVAFRFTSKEPSHDHLWLRLPPIRESDRNFDITTIARSFICYLLET
jgi:hypothetical protein